MTVINQNDPHMASSQTENFETIALFTGDTPVTTTPETFAPADSDDEDVAANTVVGRNGSGQLVPAVYGSIAPIGITTASVKADATDRRVAVYRSGMFNPAALVWDASYDTDEKKRTAFEASQPTIFVRPNKFVAPI